MIRLRPGVGVSLWILIMILIIFVGPRYISDTEIEKHSPEMEISDSLQAQKDSLRFAASQSLFAEPADGTVTK